MPLVVGHEAAGEVVELGAGVNRFSVGDHVVMIFRPSCGTCASCAVGRPALCGPGGESNAAGSLLGGYRRLSPGAAFAGGKDPAASEGLLHHHLGCSAFAEYATVSERSLVRVDATLPWHEAALFGCAVITGAGAVINTAAVPAGASVAVVGLGGVGFAALLAARAAGARRIIAVDRLSEKLQLASELGATDCVGANEPGAVERIRSASGGGVDFAFEMAGSVAALDFAYRITARGGMTVTAGLPNPAAQWPISAVSLTAEERTIKGSYVGSSVPSRDIPRLIELYRSGRLPVDRLLSEQISLEAINEGLDRLALGQSIRQVIRM
jgi:alcohol dehydrogenase